jgi:FKBP-type peptidyl-prolyl cis-trans isomerase SlyD
MKIQKNTVVTLKYTVFDSLGHVLEENDQPMIYLHGGYDGIFPAVEEVLEGKEVGYESTLYLEPERAFGEYEAKLLRSEPRDKFPEDISVGMQFEGVPNDGNDTSDVIYTITHIEDGNVILDGNHPLAGIALRFQLQVMSIREASAEEIEQQTAGDESGLTIATLTDVFDHEDDSENDETAEDDDEDFAHTSTRPRTIH